jgi:flavin reductase (DIM6/NTAB) family NADH-FMN oxidoreductase RutF
MEVRAVHINPEDLSPGRRYYLMISCIIPRPIAWVGTLNEDGSHNLAPFSYFNGLASTPPIVGIGFGPHPEKREKDTLRNVKRSSELTVSIPDFELVAKVEATSDSLPYGADEFEHAALTPVPGEVVKAPRVGEARVSFECEAYKIIPVGDTGGAILLAEIKLFHILDTLLDDHGCVDPHKFRALARMAGGRYAPVGDVFKVER